MAPKAVQAAPTDGDATPKPANEQLRKRATAAAKAPKEPPAAASKAAGEDEYDFDRDFDQGMSAQGWIAELQQRRKKKSWIPLILFIVGMAAVAVGGGEIAKRKSRILRVAYAGDLGALNEMIAAETNVDYIDWERNTALHMASFAGHVTCVRALLKAGANPNMVNLEGITPLHAAAFSGSGRIIRSLMKAGANASLQTQWGGNTPLHLATTKKCVDCVKALVAGGADVSVENFDHKKAVQEAADPEIKKMLEEAAATAAAAPKRAGLDTI